MDRPERLPARASGRVRLLRDDAAHAALRDQRFITRWRALHAHCAHATAFQAQPFVYTWYDTYRVRWSPIIVESEDEDENLVGLWFLAQEPGSTMLAHAGTHQAEYHAWLAIPGGEVAFLQAAWAQLERHVRFVTLRFKYLPNTGLADALRTALSGRAGVAVRKHNRPLLKLDGEDIRASFAKKSNKSRFNRLKKLGRLEFRQIDDPAELERVFDTLISYYDLRQGAVNGSTPFHEDPEKRAFHTRLFGAAAGHACVTATYLDDEPIAAFWGSTSGTTVHLGMLIHSPFLAEHSPGKLHVMQLSEHLLKQGMQVLDLTPGGDQWKARFANTGGEVAEAVAYRTRAAHALASTLDRVAHAGKRVAGSAGIGPDRIRSAVRTLVSARPGKVMGKLQTWVRVEREFRVYRGTQALAERCGCDERVHRNALPDLLAFEATERWHSHGGFLSTALSRLEAGESVYTVRIDERLAHYGWMVRQSESYASEVKQSITFPPGSVAFYDFYTHPDFRGRGLYRATVGHMLRSAFSSKATRYAYISVLADNLASRRVIETIGFEYQGSHFLRSRFGTERTWSIQAASSQPEPTQTVG